MEEEHPTWWNDYTKRPWHWYKDNFPREGPRRKKYGSRTNYWRDILLKDICSYCFEAISDSADHVVPLSAGAQKDEWSHLAGCCKNCNNKKGSEKLIFFIHRVYWFRTYQSLNK